MRNKELEIALNTYIALKHNQDECIGFIDGYTQCQEDMDDKPFNNFYLRLKSFVSNVQVNDPMSEEEKEMIIYVCNKQINKQD